MQQIPTKPIQVKPLVEAIRATLPLVLDPNDPMYYFKGFIAQDISVLARLRERVEADS